MVPHITQMPAGCRFHTRCPYATGACENTCPDMRDLGNGHLVRCLRDDLGEEAR